jgi:hypothetical protein
MAVLDLIFGFLVNISKSWLDLFISPIKEPSLLWIIIPIYVTWLFTERYQELHSTSFGNAVTNGAVILWGGVDWIRQIVDLYLGNSSGFSSDVIIKIVLSTIVILYGFLIIYFGLKTKKFIKYFGRIREVTYVIVMFSPMIYGFVDISFINVVAILFYFPIWYFIVEFINWVLPDPKTYDAENSSSNKNESGSLFGSSQKNSGDDLFNSNGSQTQNDPFSFNPQNAKSDDSLFNSSNRNNNPNLFNPQNNNLGLNFNSNRTGNNINRQNISNNNQVRVMNPQQSQMSRFNNLNPSNQQKVSFNNYNNPNNRINNVRVNNQNNIFPRVVNGNNGNLNMNPGKVVNDDLPTPEEILKRKYQEKIKNEYDDLPQF